MGAGVTVRNVSVGVAVAVAGVLARVRSLKSQAETSLGGTYVDRCTGISLGKGCAGGVGVAEVDRRYGMPTTIATTTSVTMSRPHPPPCWFTWPSRLACRGHMPAGLQLGHEVRLVAIALEAVAGAAEQLQVVQVVPRGV